MAVTTKVDNTAKFLASIEALTKKECLVGVPGDTSARSDGGPSNALLGYVHEFGSPARNIPARPHLIPGVQDAQDAITRALRKGADAASKGDPNAADDALNAAGLIAQSSVKKHITDGSFAPLAPATISARRRKGFESDKPLVVTGSYLNSITYVIRPKEA